MKTGHGEGNELAATGAGRLQAERCLLVFRWVRHQRRTTLDPLRRIRNRRNIRGKQHQMQASTYHADPCRVSQEDQTPSMQFSTRVDSSNQQRQDSWPHWPSRTSHGSTPTVTRTRVCVTSSWMKSTMRRGINLVDKNDHRRSRPQHRLKNIADAANRLMPERIHLHGTPTNNKHSTYSYS